VNLRNITLSILLIAFFIAFQNAKSVYAQSKIGFINSQQLIAEYQEAVDVNKRVKEISDQWEKELGKMIDEAKELQEQLEAQSLLLSEETKQQRLLELQQKAQRIDQFKLQKWGPQGGEVYKKEQELMAPVLEKINVAIKKIGEQQGYDFVFNIEVFVYVNPKYEGNDLTDEVLEELNKGLPKKKTAEESK